MSTIPTKRIDGDASIGRNVAVGGDAKVKGEATIEHNLIVKGWLDAKNIKTPNKGVFETEDGLKATYPAPLPGWWAIVLPLTTPQTSTGTANATADTLQGELYIAKAGHEKVEWAKTGLAVSVMGRLDVEAFQERTKAMSERIDLIVGPDDDSAITTLSGIVSFLTGFTTDETLQERVYEILSDLNRVETKHDGEIAGLKTRMGAVETKAESTASGMTNLQVGLASEETAREAADAAERTAREAADLALSNEIYGLRSDAYIHTVLNLVKLDNWQDKELAEALQFLWEHTQKTTMFVNSGTVIVFYSPSQGWVSYQLQHQTAGETMEHIITTPANWERFAPSTSDIAKLAALDGKATTDAAIKAVADRTTSLEGADAAQDEKIAGICTDLATAQDDITTLESRVESQRLTLVAHTSEISELRSTKADKAKVEQMASDLADAQIAITEIEENEQGFANQIVELQELAVAHTYINVNSVAGNRYYTLDAALLVLSDSAVSSYVSAGTVITFLTGKTTWESWQLTPAIISDPVADLPQKAQATTNPYFEASNWTRYAYTDLSGITEDLKTLRAAHISDTTELQNRMGVVETRTEGLTTSVNNLSSQTNSNTSHIIDVAGRTTTLERKTETAETDITNLQSSVGTEISERKGADTNIQNSITQMRAEIDAAIETASRQWLIDQAVAAGATYNISTGKFSYGPKGYVISDIGDDEMLRMLQCRVVGDGIGGAFNDANIRINLCPMVEYKNSEYLPWRQLCSKNNTIQVLRTSMYTNRQFTLASSNAISDCSALRYIEGCFIASLPQHNFTGLPALEYIWVVIRNGACINLKDSPNLTLECLQEIPSSATKSSVTATVTVHPTVYAKLTDTTNTQWHKVLTDALAKNITFATTE